MASRERNRDHGTEYSNVPAGDDDGVHTLYSMYVGGGGNDDQTAGPSV